MLDQELSFATLTGPPPSITSPNRVRDKSPDQRERPTDTQRARGPNRLNRRLSAASVQVTALPIGLAKVGVAGSNPVVRSKNRRSGPLSGGGLPDVADTRPVLLMPAHRLRKTATKQDSLRRIGALPNTSDKSSAAVNAQRAGTLRALNSIPRGRARGPSPGRTALRIPRVIVRRMVAVDKPRISIARRSSPVPSARRARVRTASAPQPAASRSCTARRSSPTARRRSARSPRAEGGSVLRELDGAPDPFR
jgi:hypothetical protein